MEFPASVRVILQSLDVRFQYPVVFTRDIFSPANPALRQMLDRGGKILHRALVAIDDGVLAANPGLVKEIAAFEAANRDRIEFVGEPLIVPGGEQCKTSNKEAERVHSLVARHHLCRHSFVLAIGGGAVLDVIGYATATAHRGLRLIRCPTTVLAQNDAGIGVKNGINFNGRKNFVGTFAPPFAVLNDFSLLSTLPDRDRRAGIAEALKVALIRDEEFFYWIRKERRNLASFQQAALESLILRCAELHLEHIRSCGDPFELGSARPLDFGHWSAHKLEELTGGELRHGEAVAIGVALDSLYSQKAGLINERQLFEILTTFEDIGFQLNHPALRELDVKQALGEFREHLGGELSITLLNGIGVSIERNEIDVSEMMKCVDHLLQVTDVIEC